MSEQHHPEVDVQEHFAGSFFVLVVFVQTLKVFVQQKVREHVYAPAKAQADHADAEEDFHLLLEDVHTQNHDCRNRFDDHEDEVGQLQFVRRKDNHSDRGQKTSDHVEHLNNAYGKFCDY